MFYWLIWALLVSLWDIAYKKSVVVSWSKLSNYWYQFISWIVYLLIILLVYLLAVFFNFQDFTNILSLKVLLIFVLIWSISVNWWILSSYAYKNEKISVLTPYQQFETIFTVIFWFIFFSWVSFVSFIFVLIAWAALIMWSIDFKNFTFNRYAFAVMLSSLIYSVKSNLLAYLLISITPLESIFYSNIFTFICALALIYFKKELTQSIGWTDKKMVIFMHTESITRILVWFVYAYLVAEIWIIQTALLWLLNIFTNMAFWYFIFKEVPTKKDYIVALIVVCCVVLWNIF